MLDSPQIVQTTSQLTAIIHLMVPRDEIQNVMGPGITEIILGMLRRRPGVGLRPGFPAHGTE